MFLVVMASNLKNNNNDNHENYVSPHERFFQNFNTCLVSTCLVTGTSKSPVKIESTQSVPGFHLHLFFGFILSYC